MNEVGRSVATDRERLVQEQIDVLSEHMKSGSPIDMGFVVRHAEMVAELASNAWAETDVSNSH